MSAAARIYIIPKSSLLDHVSSRVIHGLKPYTKAYLSPKEVGHFLKHCTKLKTRKDMQGILKLTAKEKGLLTLS